MKKKYIIFDLDWTLISSHKNINKLIFEYFKEKDPDYYDKVRYKLDFNKISNIQELLKEVYQEKNSKIKHKEIYDYLDSHNHKNNFLEWTIEKILELKNNYKLYLSTWSSTKFANEILEKWWVKKYFELIQWSDIIPKSEVHLDIFEEHSWDENFFEKSISIWDSMRDELFAKNRNIDFIKIWDKSPSASWSYKNISEIKNI